MKFFTLSTVTRALTNLGRQKVIHFMLLAQSTRSSTPLLRRLVGFEKFSLNFHFFLKLEANIVVMHSKWDVLFLLETAFCFPLRAVYLTCITLVSPILLI